MVHDVIYTDVVSIVGHGHILHVVIYSDVISTL